jgi:2-dehydropantoate 2-reductase
MLKAAVSADTALVTIQNGIDNEAAAAESFPDNEIIGGIAYVAASRIKPGVVQHLGSGTLTFGSHPWGISDKTRRLAELFTAAGVPTRTTDQIVCQRWHKMLWNASFNPISVLGGKADSLRMLADEESSQLVRKVMAEVLQIAEQVGCVFQPDTIDKIIAGTLKLDAFKTSMLVDFEAGRTMETDAILGRAVRLAREKGLSIPYLETLFALLKMHAPA